MKQAKKLLCMLLVMLMAFSTVSIGVSAAYTDYKNAPAKGYDIHEDPVLSTYQRSSQLLDYVDEMLAGMSDDLYIDISIMVLDFTSVDKALDTIDDIKGLTGLIGGDVGDLNFDSLKGTRRGTAGAYDLTILYELINFLNDNRSIVGRFLKGELDLGVIKSFVSLDLDVYVTLMDMLYEMLIDENTSTCPSGWTADKILQTVVDTYLVTGGTSANGKAVEALLPSMSGKTNINTQSIWTIIENAANAATKDLLIPLIEDTLKPKFAEWEVDYPATIWDKLNIDNLNLAGYTWGQYDKTNGIVAELNHFIYFVLDSVWTGDAFWVDGGNDMLQQNIASLLKVLYKEMGASLLPASAELLPVEEVEAMDLQQLCGYIGKQFLSAELPDVYWVHMDGDYTEALTAEPDSIAQLAVYVMYSITADIINVNYLDDVYYSYEGEFTNEYAISMLADIGVYYLNALLPISAQTGQGVEALLTVLVNWALQDTNFGGFFKGCGVSDSDSVWTKIDKTVLKVLPLQNILGGNVQGSYDLIMNHLVNAIFELDFEAILSLLYKSSSSMLNKTIPEVVVEIVNGVLNVLIARNTNATILYNPTPTSVDTLIQNSNLAVSAERLLAGLKECATYQYFWDSLFPILNPMLIDESGYVYNQASTPSNYSVKTVDQLQAKIDEYNELLALPDVYDTNPDNWNESTDFELWRYDKIEEAIDDAQDTVDDYNGAVQWVADAQVQLTEANASGDQTKIDEANTNLANANAELASFTAAVYAEAAYAIEEAYNKAMATKPDADVNTLMYILDIAAAKDFKERDYKNQPEVWANYEQALEHAQAVYDADISETKQSQLNEARKNLVNAMRLLEVKLADMTELVALIAQVKDTVLDGYAADKVEAFQNILADAQAMAGELLSIDEQDDVDRMVERLQEAFDALAKVVAPVLEALQSGVKIDTDKLFVAGIDTLTSAADLLAKFVNSDENGTATVETVNGAAKVGTGAKVILKDNSGAEVATYEVVIYGDANGDGLVDIMDTLCLDLYTVYDANHNYANGSAQWTALNLDNSNAVDANDAVILDSYANFAGEINQQNPFAA